MTDEPSVGPGGSVAGRIVVAHHVFSYLFATCSWIYWQLSHMSRVTPVVLCHATENLDQFPMKSVFDYSELWRFQKAWLCLWKRRRHRVDDMYFEWIVRRLGAAALHAHFGPAGVAMLELKRQTGLPLVTAFYGSDAARLPNDPRWREQYARLFAEGDLFLAEGNAMRRTLIDLGCPPQKVVVQHLGVPLTRLPFVPRRADPSGVVKILITATFREKKGIPDALEAVERVRRRHPRLQVTLIGDVTADRDSDEKERILRRLARLEGTVEWHGLQPYAAFRAALSTHHIFLSPSRTAADGDSEGGAPVTLLEAQATGMPVVSTLHADIPEVVLDGKSGLLSPERDLERLVENLDRVVSTPTLWDAMGAEGRAHVEAHYNIQTQVRLLENLYKRLLPAA
jgi:colanic acid/amylovoran/stewartan biosynthesis glycosyltransferase WcaL/AmsK/CpsK